MNPYDDALKSLDELFEELEELALQCNTDSDTIDVNSDVPVGAIAKQYSDDLRPICSYVAGPNTLQ